MLLKNIQEQFPFITVVHYGDNEFVGIIANQDQIVTTMYVITELKNEQAKADLIELGEIWWWESNRMLPINIFLRDEMEEFNYSLITMNSKDVKITLGPCVNLNNLSIKRVKRKSVQLVKKPKD